MKRDKLLLLVIVGLLIWVFGPNLLYLLDTSVNSNTSVNSTVESQIANLENQYRVTITQAFVGIAILFGVYQTWQRISIAEDNLKVAQDNLKVSQESQITERFTRAVEQLGNPAIEIRLGGIYALERIANESETDYWPIMKILAAYIREKSPIKWVNIENKDCEEQEKDKELPTDIQVILEVICKREHTSNEKLDLRNSNLRKAQLSEAHLECADLRRADIWGADLEDAHLESAQLHKAHLEDATLVSAHLENAYMRETHLERAYLQGIDLKNATLRKAYLDDAHLQKAVLVRAFLEETHLDRAHLEGAHFEHAHLKGAYLNDAQLIGTHFEIANLEGAHLEGADLKSANFSMANLMGAHFKGAKNLTIEQLSKVKTLYNTELDEELRRSLEENHPDLFENPDK